MCLFVAILFIFKLYVKASHQRSGLNCSKVSFLAVVEFLWSSNATDFWHDRLDSVLHGFLVTYVPIELQITVLGRLEWVLPRTYFKSCSYAWYIKNSVNCSNWWHIQVRIKEYKSGCIYWEMSDEKQFIYYIITTLNILKTSLICSFVN